MPQVISLDLSHHLLTQFSSMVCLETIPILFSQKSQQALAHRNFFCSRVPQRATESASRQQDPLFLSLDPQRDFGPLRLPVT